MQQTTTRPVTETTLLLKIKKNVTLIETKLKKSIGQQILDQKKDDKNKKTLRSKLAEKKLEKNKKSLLDKAKDKVGEKAGSIFDRIINFFVMTFYGFLFTKLLPILPKLVGLIQFLKPVGAAIGFITRLVLDVFTTFISAGYFVKDTFSKKADNIKKEPIQKEYVTFNNALKSVLDKTIDVTYTLTGQNPEKPQEKQKPVKAAQTGGVPAPTRGNIPVSTPPSRKIRETPQNKIKRKQTQQDTIVGKDVGGEEKVRRYYNSPKLGSPTIFGLPLPQPNNPTKKSPVDSISSISKNLRGRRLLFGDMASVGSDIAIGQKPNKNTYKNTAIDILQLADFISDKREESTRQSLIAMAYGGVIPSQARNVAKKPNMVDFVANIIQRSVEQRVNQALSEMRRNIMTISLGGKKQGSQKGNAGISPEYYGPGGPPSVPGEGYADEYGNISKIEIGGFNPEDVSILGRIIEAEAGGESDLGKASVLNVILNRYRLIKSGKASPSQFGISGISAKDVRIRDIIFAKNGREFSPVKPGGSFFRISDEQGLRALEKAIRAGGNDPQKLLENLKKGRNAADADYIVRSVGFYNPKTAESVPFNSRTVMVGAHGFQQSPDTPIRGKIGSIEASISSLGNIALEPGKYQRVINEFTKDQLFLGAGERRGNLVGHRDVGFTDLFLDRGGTHAGVDIGTSKQKGYLVGFKLSGKVVHVGYDEGAAGHNVTIRASNGQEYRFLHLARIDPKIKVGSAYGGEGQLIGEIGNTGRSTGEHLHFERFDPKLGTINPLDDTKFLSIGKKSIIFEQKNTVISPNDPLSKQFAILELHAGAPSDKTGIIRSMLDPDNPLTRAIAGKYGEYERGFRDLGGPKRGLSLIELIAMNEKNTQDLLNPDTRNAVIEREAKKLFDVLKQHPSIQIKLFAGHGDVTRGETGTSGTRGGASIGGLTLEQYFTRSVAARVAALAKKEKLSNIQYLTSLIANEGNDPNSNWSRAKALREALLLNQPSLNRNNNITPPGTTPSSNRNRPGRTTSQRRTQGEPMIFMAPPNRTYTGRRPPSRVTGRRPSGPIPRSPKREWYDPRGWFGMNRGGYVGKSSYIPNGYASYEMPNSRVILAIQEKIVQQYVQVDKPFAIPFPVSTNVNSKGNYRA